MRLTRRRPQDEAALDLLDECAANIRCATVALRDLVADYPEHAGLAAEIARCEHEGDRITHDLIHLLDGGPPRGRRLPFEPFDGHVLATALDDVVDHAEAAADMLAIYRVEAPMQQAEALAHILVEAGEQVALALGGLRNGNDPSPHLVEIHRLENDGDRVSRDAVASLFVSGIDPMVVICWKDIFASLEAAVDACETVAHVLEGIMLKRRGRGAPRA